jgi:hypothetical protein
MSARWPRRASSLVISVRTHHRDDVELSWRAVCLIVVPSLKIAFETVTHRTGSMQRDADLDIWLG